MWIASLVVSLFAIPLAQCQSGSASDIRLPPTITVGPVKGDYYRTGLAFTLQCTARGVPEVSYEWKRNGVDLNLNGANVRRVVDGTITISDAGALDAGFYQCIAKNQYGTALSNTSWMQQGVIETRGSTDVATKTVKEGDPFCVEAHPSKSVPKAKATWEKAESIVDKYPTLITLSKRIQIAENGDLCFAYAKPEDDLAGKIYKLTEFNEQIDLTTGGSYTKVTITRDPAFKEFPPTLGFSSLPQTVAVEGQQSTLRCFYSGNPEPNLAWSGPNNTLPIGRYLHTVGTYKSGLTIQNVQPSDEGDYVCTADNGKGSNKHVMQMRVEAVPKFLSPDDQPHDTNVTEGATLTFKCQTYAKPEATVIWLRNGVQLDLNQLPRRYRVSSDKKSLTIEGLCRDCTDRSEFGQTDLTIIQCNASNTHGYAFGAGYVNVLLKTTVVVIGEEKVTVEMQEDREFTWECKATSDPSTPLVLKWFKETKDGDQLVYEEPPALLLKDGNLKIHVVPNKTESWEKYRGIYRCDADNGYTKQSVKRELAIANYVPPGPATAGIGTYWWIILLILLLILLIIIVCCCCICMQRNKGDKYDVDEKERKNGNDPEKELDNNGFHDYQRPEGQNLKGSRPSLGSTGKLHSDDEASLMEFGDDPGKFTEDGSFVGAYASNTRGRRD